MHVEYGSNLEKYTPFGYHREKRIARDVRCCTSTSTIRIQQ